MHKILAIAICFIPLINGMAKEQIERIFTGKLYRGYNLTESENSIYSFIGIHYNKCLISIVAQRQNSFSPLDFIEYTWDKKDRYHCYTEWFNNSSRLHMKPFSPTHPDDKEISNKAFALSRLYLTISSK